jgi:hypothetical protein
MTIFGLTIQDLLLPALLVGWFLLMFLVLPKMGVST